MVPLIIHEHSAFYCFKSERLCSCCGFAVILVFLSCISNIILICRTKKIYIFSVPQRSSKLRRWFCIVFVTTNEKQKLYLSGDDVLKKGINKTKVKNLKSLGSGVMVSQQTSKCLYNSKYLLRPEIPTGPHTEMGMNGISIVPGLFPGLEENSKDRSFSPVSHAYSYAYEPFEFLSQPPRLFFWKSIFVSLRLCSSFSVSASCE